MNKAVIGVFPDGVAAGRAVNDLKASGFPGESVGQVLREDIGRDGRLPGPNIAPAMEIVKGLVIGLVVGAILGVVAYEALGIDATWTGSTFGPLGSTLIVMAAVGGICGLLEGLAAIVPLAAARNALMGRRRGDSIVSVHTDETHAKRATDLLRSAGATDIRRGASSVDGEFRTQETVQAETYGTPTTVVTRDDTGVTSGAYVEGSPAGQVVREPVTRADAVETVRDEETDGTIG